MKNLVKKFGQENVVDKKNQRKFLSKKSFCQKEFGQKMFVQKKVSVSKYFTRKKLDPTFFSGDF